MSSIIHDPLFGAAPEEIHLPQAPLVTVLCQVRFPEIVSIQKKQFIAGFQERVRGTYPLMHEDVLKTVALESVGTVATSDEVVWRFVDAPRNWRLTLTSTFLTLETRKYETRVHFIERFGEVVEALQTTLKPSHVTRLGMRYVDRVAIKDGVFFDGMLRDEMKGVTGPAGLSVIHSVSEIACKVQEGQMLARWGLLPARGSHDPDVLPPVQEASWFLDVDTSADHVSSPVSFDAAKIRADASALSMRSYSFFRWAVTDEFLKAFGGKTA